MIIIYHEITPTDLARNLGSRVSWLFGFQKHISLVCNSCYYHIRDLGLRHLRRCLMSEVSKTIATAPFFSRPLPHRLPVSYSHISRHYATSSQSIS